MLTLLINNTIQIRNDLKVDSKSFLINNKSYRGGYVMTNPTVQSKQKKSNKILMEGKKFGRWAVLEEAGRSNYRTVMWKCLCSCGTVRDVSGDDVRSGHSVSCGCFKMDKITKHGMHKTTTYRTWVGILTRCNNPN